MANSADPDQLVQKPTDLDIHCLDRQDISGSSRTRVKDVMKLHRNCYGGVFGDKSRIFFFYFCIKTYVVGTH